jgi:hypothetical protein
MAPVFKYLKDGVKCIYPLLHPQHMAQCLIKGTISNSDLHF